MDDLRKLLDTYYRFRPTFKLKKAPPKPSTPTIVNNDGGDIGEMAFVVGLGEMNNETSN